MCVDIVVSDMRSETMQRTRGFASMATLCIFITMLQAKFELQHYKGKAALRFLGNGGSANSPHCYTVHCIPFTNFY